MIDHVYVTRGARHPGAHGHRHRGARRRRQVSELHRALRRASRSRIDGVPTDRGMNPGGNVRFADPSCWVEVSLVSVAVNVVPSTPAATAAGRDHGRVRLLRSWRPGGHDEHASAGRSRRGGRQRSIQQRGDVNEASRAPCVRRVSRSRTCVGAASCMVRVKSTVSSDSRCRSGPAIRPTPTDGLGCGDAADRRGPSARRRPADEAPRQADRAGRVPIPHAATGRDPGRGSDPLARRDARPKWRPRSNRSPARRSPSTWWPSPSFAPASACWTPSPTSTRTPWSATWGWSATRRRTSRGTTTRSSRRSADGTRCCSTRCSPRVGPAPPRPRTCRRRSRSASRSSAWWRRRKGSRAWRPTTPGVPIIAGALDRKLNEHAYIVPGLGDFGDRLYGTV